MFIVIILLFGLRILIVFAFFCSWMMNFLRTGIPAAEAWPDSYVLLAVNDYSDRAGKNPLNFFVSYILYRQ